MLLPAKKHEDIFPAKIAPEIAKNLGLGSF